jgi:hypothetical protein
MSNYPSPPAARLSYDQDGSLFYVRNTGISGAEASAYDVLGTLQTQGNLNAIADEDYATQVSGGQWSNAYWLIFPTQRDISHVLLMGTGGNVNIQWSPNTTNGVDGTWTTLTIAQGPNTGTRAAMRSAMVATPTLLGVKAIRWFLAEGGAGNAATRVLHLYGKPTATGNRLEFWHPTLDQSLRVTPAWLDWGDRVRGTTQVKSVRLKNVSSSLTASGITVSVSALTESGAPTFVSQHSLRINAGSYGSTVSIATLAPGAISQVIDIRQVLDPAASLSLWSQRLNAVATSWA